MMPTSTFRFRMPSFLGGMASVLDLTGGTRISLGGGENAALRDARALANDWAMVSGDIGRSFRRVSVAAHRVRHAHGDGAW